MSAHCTTDTNTEFQARVNALKYEFNCTDFQAEQYAKEDIAKETLDQKINLKINALGISRREAQREVELNASGFIVARHPQHNTKLVAKHTDISEDELYQLVGLLHEAIVIQIECYSDLYHEGMQLDDIANHFSSNMDFLMYRDSEGLYVYEYNRHPDQDQVVIPVEQQYSLNFTDEELLAMVS